MSLRKMNRYPLEHWPELAVGCLVRVPRQEIRIQGSIFPGIIDQREASQQKDGSY